MSTAEIEGEHKPPIMGCPYYTATALATQAHIVFCPYNYLVDPHIAAAMKIDFSEAVVVVSFISLFCSVLAPVFALFFLCSCFVFTV